MAKMKLFETHNSTNYRLKQANEYSSLTFNYSILCSSVLFDELEWDIGTV